MKILKGKKDRTPEYNEFAYSGGSVYEEHNMDKVANTMEASLRAANSYTDADFRENREKLDAFRKQSINTILNRYPPQFAIGTRWQTQIEIEGECARWNLPALVILSADIESFHYFMFDLGQHILEYIGFDFNDWKLDSRAALEKALLHFETLINNAVDEKITPDINLRD